jgi:hypothetical protein
MGWVASHEHILLPFITPQTQTLPSADTKARDTAINEERLGVRHYIWWYHTIFADITQFDTSWMLLFGSNLSLEAQPKEVNFRRSENELASSTIS